jgi:hypothetical protein
MDDVVEVEPDDSTDGGVLVNGNDGEEHWGMNKKGTFRYHKCSSGSVHCTIQQSLVISFDPKLNKKYTPSVLN